jgi:hypothetical protein
MSNIPLELFFLIFKIIRDVSNNNKQALCRFFLHDFILLFSSLYRIAITFVSLFGTFVLISDLGGQEKMEKRMTTGRSSMKSTIKVVVQRSIHEENVDNLQGRMV